MYARHGDLGFTPIKKLPEGLKLVYTGCKFILARGEQTGHTHVLTAEQGTAFKILEDEKGQRYLKLGGNGTMTHEEHKTIEIEKGMYLIRQEREYSYWELQTNKVVD